eukprot:scaffold24069_cov29-Prasinocladus_malaysianus.AAC.2
MVGSMSKHSGDDLPAAPFGSNLDPRDRMPPPSPAVLAGSGSYWPQVALSKPMALELSLLVPFQTSKSVKKINCNMCAVKWFPQAVRAILYAIVVLLASAQVSRFGTMSSHRALHGFGLLIRFMRAYQLIISAFTSAAGPLHTPAFLT